MQVSTKSSSPDQGSVASIYASKKALKEVFSRHEFFTKYSLGQNFLIQDQVVRKILNLSPIQSGDLILEVGPGIGTLSWALLNKGAKLISVEADKSLPEVLEDTLSEFLPNFSLIEGDALKLSKDQIVQATKRLDSESLPKKLVANLPYNIAASLILDYFLRFPFLEEFCVMVQAEVADRICAEIGTKNYGAYSAKLAQCAEFCGRFEVPPHSFEPAPRVNSAVILLRRKKGSQNAELDYPGLFSFIDACFSQRRKTLRNNLKSHYSDADLQEACLKMGIELSLRAERLAPHELVELYKILRS